jgi:hypothetical protein
MKTLEAIM